MYVVVTTYMHQERGSRIGRDPCVFLPLFGEKSKNKLYLQNFKFSGFPIFRFWAYLCEKRVVRTKFDIYFLLLLSLSRYLCWWTITLISSRWCYPPSSQCVGTDMFITEWNLQFLNNVIINKIKVLLPQTQLTLLRFSSLRHRST